MTLPTWEPVPNGRGETIAWWNTTRKKIVLRQACLRCASVPATTEEALTHRARRCRSCNRGLVCPDLPCELCKWPRAPIEGPCAVCCLPGQYDEIGGVARHKQARWSCCGIWACDDGQAHACPPCERCGGTGGTRLHDGERRHVLAWCHVCVRWRCRDVPHKHEPASRYPAANTESTA